MIGVSQLLEKAIGPNPGKDEVQLMLDSRTWFFVVWSCLNDAEALSSDLNSPELTAEQRAFAAGRLDATERIISRLPRAIVGKGTPPDPVELKAEQELRETLKGLFHV